MKTALLVAGGIAAGLLVTSIVGYMMAPKPATSNLPTNQGVNLR
mgnify:CR=1 FL=1